MMNFRKRTPRESAGMNMSSTADIALLLLIFFLVTTTIFYDSGIPVKLPPWAHSNQIICGKVRSRNLFTVVVNSNNQLLVEDEIADIRNLKRDAKEFILNPKKLDHLSVSPKNAIISLQNDRGTNYETYFNIYNELKAAYNEIWDEAAVQKFGFKYKTLSYDDKKEIRNNFPLIISEVEPTDFLAEVK